MRRSLVDPTSRSLADFLKLQHIWWRTTPLPRSNRLCFRSPGLLRSWQPISLRWAREPCDVTSGVRDKTAYNGRDRYGIPCRVTETWRVHKAPSTPR